jgi:hypothetical protein
MLGLHGKQAQRQAQHCQLFHGLNSLKRGWMELDSFLRIETADG